jgi:hypothetical protein
MRLGPATHYCPHWMCRTGDPQVESLGQGLKALRGVVQQVGPMLPFPGGFVSSQPRKKGFDKLQDMSRGGITHLIPITKIGPETIP